MDKNDQKKGPRDGEAEKDAISGRPISRRSFIQAVTLLPAACLLSRCGDSSSRTGSDGSAADGSAADGFLIDGSTDGSVQERYDVMIGQADSYDRTLLRQRLSSMLDQLNGFSSLISSQDSVVVKPNLTGFTSYDPQHVGTERYITHPDFTRVLCELLRDAGAGDIYIAEGIFGDDSFTHWGYEAIAQDLGATLIDLNEPDPYQDFDTVTVPDHLAYESFYLNRILQETDHFVSVAKLKCHASCGVTLASKNLIGLVPINLYDSTGQNNMRHDFHQTPLQQRLPNIIVDLCRARPISLSLIDGIMSAEGGEGPWNPNYNPVQPHLLIAGMNHVATDSVAMATMGFDPMVDYPDQPFANANSHIKIAAAAGLGTNIMSEIRVGGASIEDVLFDFSPA